MLQSAGSTGMLARHRADRWIAGNPYGVPGSRDARGPVVSKPHEPAGVRDHECDSGPSHQYSRDVKGNRLPSPLPGGCTGCGWTLKTAAHPGG